MQLRLVQVYFTASTLILYLTKVQQARVKKYFFMPVTFYIHISEIVFFVNMDFLKNLTNVQISKIALWSRFNQIYYHKTYFIVKSTYTVHFAGCKYASFPIKYPGSLEFNWIIVECVRNY